MTVNKILAVALLIPILVLVIPNVCASESNDKRYSDGYSNGSDAASRASVYDVTCDPNNQFTSGGGHSTTYCNGWTNGYNAEWNNLHSASTEQTQNQGGSQGQDYSTGWSDGQNQAQSDWNSHQLSVSSGGNSQCPDGHTDAYCQGYVNGYNDEWDRSAELNQSTGAGSSTINWEDLCNSYGSLVGIHTSCDQLAHGTQLTQEGRTALACLFTGGIGVLSGLINPGNYAEIQAAARNVCP